MHVEKHDTLAIAADDDIVRVRQRVRDWAVSLGFSLVDQTKLVTAASELARNTLIYGRGGTLTLETVVNERKRGLRLSCARRLAQDFTSDSKVGEGTRVVIARWN